MLNAFTPNWTRHVWYFKKQQLWSLHWHCLVANHETEIVHLPLTSHSPLQIVLDHQSARWFNKSLQTLKKLQQSQVSVWEEKGLLSWNYQRHIERDITDLGSVEIVLDLYSPAEPENVHLLFQKPLMIQKPGQYGARAAQIQAHIKYNTIASATFSVANLTKQIVPREGRTIHCDYICCTMA